MKDTLATLRQLTLNTIMKYGIDWESKPYEEIDISYDWTRMNGGYARCLTANNLYASIEVIMPPNASMDYHIHPDADEEFYVIEGHVELTVLNKTINVREGETHRVKAGLLHKALYPYGMRGIITLRKISSKQIETEKSQLVDIIQKIRGEEDPAPVDVKLD